MLFWISFVHPLEPEDDLANLPRSLQAKSRQLSLSRVVRLRRSVKIYHVKLSCSHEYRTDILKKNNILNINNLSERENI